MFGAEGAYFYGGGPAHVRLGKDLIRVFCDKCVTKCDNYSVAPLLIFA